MNEWTDSVLGDVLPLKYGKNLPETKRISGDVPVYSSAGHIGFHDSAVVSEPSIIVGRKGSVGTVYYEQRACFPIDTAFYTVGSDDINLRFGYYALLNANLSQHSQDSAVPGLNRDTYSSIPLSLPSAKEQDAIAEVLAALDDKIVANIKLATTADELVRAEFDLMSSMCDEQITVGELVTNNRHSANPELLATCVPYVGLEHIPRRFMWLQTHGDSSEVSSNKSHFEAGDVLFGKLRPYFHKIVSAPIAGICSTDVLVLRPKTTELAGFILAAISHDNVVRAVTAASQGTRMPRTGWNDLSAISIPWPGHQAAESFSSKVAVIREHVISILAENQDLMATRDALLPQLMSGTRRVKAIGDPTD